MYITGFGMWRKVPLLTGSMPRWRWRKMRIPSLIWILHLMNLTKGQDNTKLLRHRRKYSSLTRHFHLSNTVVRHDSWEMCLIFPLFSQWKVVYSGQTLHMETISVFFQLSENNVVIDFHRFYTLAHYEFESLALCVGSDLIKASCL